jgi:magnesium transporter
VQSQSPEHLAEHIRLHLEDNPEPIPRFVQELPSPDVADALNLLTLCEAGEVLALLPMAKAIEICDQPTLRRRSALFEQLEPTLAAHLLDGVAADQRTDIMRRMSLHGRRRLLPLLSAEARTEVEQLLLYPEHSAGDLMTTEFVRLRPEMTVAQALEHIRSVARDRETIYACYVLEPGTGKLLGAVSLRDLIMADQSRAVSEVMRHKPVTVGVTEDQDHVARKISKYNLLAVPVLEVDGRIVGFVTVDDVIDAIVHESTQDALRMGAVEPGALDMPYIHTSLLTLVHKRATWLVILFLGEMLTATAMGFFEEEIAKAVVLALFVPLIISSGGNSGSQATTLVIRALALHEIQLGDWWRVLRREVLAGLMLGVILGSIGFARIGVWTIFTPIYGEHWLLVALTVGFALVGIVLWGSLAGAMLPFLLKRLGLDPATSSAPFVATLVDVTGLIIYFTVASVILHGTLL